PAGHFHAPKRGFVGPTSAWLRNELRPIVVDELSDQRLRRLGYFDAGTVDRLLDEHLTHRHNREGILWAMLCFSTWHRLYVEGVTVPPYDPAAPAMIACESAPGRGRSALPSGPRPGTAHLRRAPTAARCRLPALAAAGLGSGSRAAGGQLLRVPPAAAHAASRGARRAGEGPAGYRAAPVVLPDRSRRTVRRGAARAHRRLRHAGRSARLVPGRRRRSPAVREPEGPPGRLDAHDHGSAGDADRGLRARHRSRRGKRRHRTAREDRQSIPRGCPDRGTRRGRPEPPVACGRRVSGPRGAGGRLLPRGRGGRPSTAVGGALAPRGWRIRGAGGRDPVRGRTRGSCCAG